MAEPDDLYTLRQQFYVGNFQGALNEGATLNRLAESLVLEKDEFMYRSQIGLRQYDVPLSEIRDNAPISLQAIKLLAMYESNESSKEAVMTKFQEWLNDIGSANNSTIQLVGAIIYLKEGLVKDALRIIRHGTTLEQLALTASIYLRMDRPDHAVKQLQLMQQADEDATLTQLTNAWINLYQGGPHFQEAGYIFQELIDKFGPSLALLNGLAVANLHQGRYEEAESALIQAMQNNSSDPDTLINLIATSQHLHKPADLITRYINQLTRVAPKHPYVLSLSTMENAFDRLATQYAGHIGTS